MFVVTWHLTNVLRLMVFAFIVLFAALLVRGAPQQSVSCDLEVSSLLPELIVVMQELSIPGVQVAYVAPDGQRFDCVVGMSVFDGRNVPITTKDQFRYASLSKMMTGFVAAYLVEQDRLDLDLRLVDAISTDSLVDPRVAQITVRHLLEHRAGMDRALSGDSMLNESPWCPRDVEAGVSTLRLDHEPGTAYVYSNLGYCLLGEILSRQEKMPLEDLYRRLLLDPHQLRMSLAKKGARLEREVGLHIEAGDRPDPIGGIDYSSMVAVGAWGGTASEFAEMVRHALWGEASLLASEARQLLLNEGCEGDIGQWRGCRHMGLYQFQAGGPVMYWRDGSLPGLSTFAGFTEDGAVLVLLANGRMKSWMANNDRLGLVVYRWLASRESEGDKN